MEFRGQMRAIDHPKLVVHSPAKLGKMHFAHHKERKQRLTGIVHIFTKTIMNLLWGCKTASKRCQNRLISMHLKA